MTDMATTEAMSYVHPGLNIKVVLWLHSTKTSVGLPDSIIILCGGPVVIRESFDNNH